MKSVKNKKKRQIRKLKSVRKNVKKPESTAKKHKNSQQDIANRRKKDDVFRSLSRAVEQSPASIVITDLKGAIEYVNPKFVQLTGYSFEEVKGQNPRVLKSGETPSKEYAKLWTAITSGGEWRGEFHNKKKNGEMYWESAVISPITNTHGKITHFLAVKEDITEKKLNEEKIKRNEARLRSLVNILQYNAKTTQGFLDNALNEAINLTESKIGYIYIYHEDRKQFVLNTWSKDVMKECLIVEPQTCYELETTGIWGEAVRQRKPIIINDFQVTHPLKKGYPEGHAHLLKFMTIPVFKKGSIVAVVGVANKASDYDEIDVLQLSLLMESVWSSVDIKRVEDAIKENEERFHSVTQSAYDAIITADSHGVIIDWNHGAEKMFGYAEAEAEGKPLSLIIPQEYQERHTHGMQRLIDGGAPNVIGSVVEMHGLHKNGKMFPLELSLSEWQTSKGKYYTGIIRDITQRKQAEQELQQTMKERENLIRELQYALENIKTLQGLIPICANCKKIRDDKGYWNQVEGYISAHTDAKFSHGICPDCAKKLYGDVYDKADERLSKKNISPSEGF